MVPLIAFSDERLPAYPDVRTVKELGKDFSYYNWRALAKLGAHDIERGRHGDGVPCQVDWKASREDHRDRLTQ